MPRGRQKYDSATESTSSTSTHGDETDETISTCKLLDAYRNDDGTLDYDYFYNTPNETPVQLECSLVRHMLGQVKIGMDLSKITLPTFILERRSLLEMYADHFAHVQLFAAIADGNSPHERMTAALRWYLTSFHAGRNYDVARKPYNPLLGEIFLCHYEYEDASPPLAMDKSKSSSRSGGQNKSASPLPWVSENNLNFYAEQVSHHPPVSAFYAELAKKRIMCNAHIWTKSKFYGLSIGVINIGSAVVTVLDHNEEYVFTFPSGYARSIMTVPYIELGGPVTGRCPQTGFRAEIEFLTKSFYSAKRNRVACKVYYPNSETVNEVIEGDWSGLLRYKKINDNTSSVFADVATLPVSTKVVRPIAEQNPSESRNLWREVTAALYVNEIALATKYKRQLERMQRDASNQRKQQRQVYEPKRFSHTSTEDETIWKYHPNLIDRLKKTDTQNLLYL